MTDLVAIDVDRVDDFLAHVGVKGMKWGHHKPGVAPVAGGGGRRVANPQKQSWGDRRAAQGQKVIDRAGGSAKKAGLHLAGKYVATQLALHGAQVAVRHLPTHPAVKEGAVIALGVLRLGNQVKTINTGVKIAQANSRNKKKS